MPISQAFENMKMKKFVNFITAEELSWDLSTEEYSEQETYVPDHWDQIIHPAAAAKGLVFVSTVNSYSLAYDAVDAIDDNDLATAL